MSPNPANLRREYERHALTDASVSPSPFTQFGIWFDEAVKAKVHEPNAMVVASATSTGQPSARVMLLKGFDDHGFVFFTNYSSRKAGEIDANPRAALVFFWPELERQVRIEGSITKVSPAETAEYFSSRPRESQIAAWTSHQSRQAKSRDELEKRHKELVAKFGSGPIPIPDFWGGYRVAPTMLEFWQGRPSRLHDRIVYHRQPDGSWEISRLEP